MKNFKEKSGFTLIEVLVAMSIFMIFVGILINSYTSIVRSYDEANEYRKLYVEARDVFETLTREIRDGMYDYKDNDTDRFLLISKDAQYRTEFCYDDDDKILYLVKSDFEETTIDCNSDDKKEQLNHNVLIENWSYYITPTFDPYNIDNFYYDNAFHPMITIYADFKAKEDSIIEDYSFELQTTVSSRIYNQVYE